MPEELREKRLSIVIDDSWRGIEYDKSLFFNNGPRKAQQIGGVDFILLNEGGSLFLVEVKDSKEFDKGDPVTHLEELVQKVAKQVSDTVSGIVGASRSNVDGLWGDAAKILIDADGNFLVIACVDMKHPEGKEHVFISSMEQKLKSKLSWLSCKVTITSSEELGDYLPGSVVKKIPIEVPH